MRDYVPKSTRLPQDVYNRALWHIRGYDRIKEELADLVEQSPPTQDGQPHGSSIGDPTSEAAMRRERLRRDLAIIEESLLDIPEEYRAVILENTARRTPLSRIPAADYASAPTWSKHRMTFITGVATRAGYADSALMLEAAKRFFAEAKEVTPEDLEDWEG